MIIEENCRVMMHYTVSLPEGDVLESSEGEAPLEVVYGSGGIIPGLERELGGMAPGDEKQVVVEPGDAYGERNDEAVVTVPRDSFPQDQPLEPGMMFHMRRQDGTIQYATILEDLGEELKMDFNHPLAGKTLHFKVKIVDVLEPSAGCGCGCGGGAGHGHGGHGHGDGCGGHGGGGGCGSPGSCCG